MSETASWPKPTTRPGYDAVVRELDAMQARGDEGEWTQAMRWYSRFDLYFLNRYVLSTGTAIKLSTGQLWADHPVIFDYIKAVEQDWEDVCDIGARGIGKSTVGTFSQPIQWVLCDPHTAIGIFSVRIKLATAHLVRIKRELEQNALLKRLFPEILYDDPGSSSRTEGSPLWANDSIVVKRGGSRMEATIEVSGFLDNMVTGKHFDYKVYDDCEDKETVTTEDQRSKAIEAYKLSLALKSSGCRNRYIGTYYHHASLYTHLENSGIRIRKTPACRMDLMPEGVDPAEVAGSASRKGGKTRDVTYKQIGGYPAVETVAQCVKDFVSMGEQHYGQQMQCDASAGSTRRLDVTKVHRYREHPRLCAKGKVRYLVVDPANSKKAGSDKTAMAVIALGKDRNVYVLDLVKARMDPSERIRKAFELHRRWAPLREVRWEEVGLASDVHWLQEEQRRQSYRFRVESISATWRNAPDEAVVSFLEPLLAEERLYVPYTLLARDEYGEEHDEVEELLEEMRTFPLGKENHYLHAIALLHERKGVNPLLWPSPDHEELESESDRWREAFRRAKRGGGGGKTWMAAI